MKYNKPSLEIGQQIELLKKRNLLFKDEARAAHYLSNISYYRLRAYTYPFQDNLLEDQPFKKEIYFEDILDLYIFDRQLRLVVFDAIEKIEIALRTKIIYTYCLQHGSHWHENSKLYISNYRYIRDLE